MKRLAIALLLTTSPLFAQNTEKILFPVLSSSVVHGAFGSTFKTTLMAYLPPAPATSIVEYADPAGVSSGRLLTFDTSTAFDYELLSTGTSAVPPDTTQLPVVRERDFRTGTTYLLGMPSTPVYDPTHSQVPPLVVGWAERNTLRIYDVDNTGTFEADTTIVTGQFPSVSSPGPHIRADRRDGNDASYPYYAVVNFGPQCYTQQGTCIPVTSMIVIQPTSPAARYWAFLSTTDNTTQYVTIRAPQ